MKKLILLSGLFFFLHSAFSEQDNPENLNEKKSFKDGEMLIYSLDYGIIHGGKAVLMVNQKSIDGNLVHHAVVRAKSEGLTKKLFYIDDRYESYFNTETCLPYKSVRDINEGGYKFYNEVDFTYKDTLVYSKKSGEKIVPYNTFDMVSAFYYLRNINMDTLKKGDVIHFITYFADEIFPFEVRYKGKERVKTKMGKIVCHKFDPIVEPGRIFKSEDDMSFWITDDENMLPVLIKFDLIVGSVTCELIAYKNIISKISSEN